MRSQTLLAQKPKRVGRLANVGAKVRNINETVKLFGNFLLFNNFFAWFEGCLSTVHLIKWEVSHGTISPAKAAYLRESSGTGSLHVPVPKTLFKAYILYYIYPQYTFSRFDQHFSRFVSAFSILFRNFATEIINNLKLMSLWKRKKKRKCSSTSSWWTTLTEEQTMFHSKTGRLHLTHRVNIIIVL